MLSIANFNEAEAALEAYMPLAHEIIGKDISLERMRPLMRAVGSPETRLKVVHVAGTSGKTSTAYYAAALLRAAGKTVGLTVSPHMDTIAERVQLNCAPLDELTFCQQLTEFLTLVEASGVQTTYYEVLMAFAYWYFDKVSVDYAVIETGLGGLHDGSNVAKRPDKVCIITDIGYDHMHILGDTIEEIAAQKAGIIHAGNHVCMHEQSEEVMTVFKDQITKMSAELHTASMEEPLPFKNELSNMPLFKKRNWLLAYKAYAYIAQRDGFKKTNETAIKATIDTYVPGRMEQVSVGRVAVVMDGAHNEQKMAAFTGSFRALYGERPTVVLFAMIRTKDYEGVLQNIKTITDTVVCTSVGMVGGEDKKAVDPEALKQKAHELGITNVYANSDAQDAFHTALELVPDGGILVVTGSLYLLSNLRKLYKELRHG